LCVVNGGEVLDVGNIRYWDLWWVSRVVEVWSIFISV